MSVKKITSGLLFKLILLRELVFSSLFIYFVIASLYNVDIIQLYIIPNLVTYIYYKAWVNVLYTSLLMRVVICFDFI